MRRMKKIVIKKTFSLLITLCFAVALIPQTVSANTTVTEVLEFKTSTSSSGPGYDWDHTSRTLTLTNFS